MFFLVAGFKLLVSICILHILQSACQVRLQMGEERESDDEVRNNFASKHKERPQSYQTWIGGTQIIKKTAIFFRKLKNPFSQYYIYCFYKENHKAVKYPGEPLKTLAALVFQVGKHNGFFFVLNNDALPEKTDLYSCLEWWQQQSLWSSQMKVCQTQRQINLFQIG